MIFGSSCVTYWPVPVVRSHTKELNSFWTIQPVYADPWWGPQHREMNKQQDCCSPFLPVVRQKWTSQNQSLSKKKFSVKLCLFQYQVTKWLVTKGKVCQYFLKAAAFVLFGGGVYCRLRWALVVSLFAPRGGDVSCQWMSTIAGFTRQHKNSNPPSLSSKFHLLPSARRADVWQSAQLPLCLMWEGPKTHWYSSSLFIRDLSTFHVQMRQ